MARIATVSPADFEPELAALLGYPSNAERVALGSMVGWARRPQIAMAFVEFQRTLHEATSLPARLLELVRLRVSFHNQCRSCMAVRSSQAIDDGMDEGAVCSLQRPYESPDLTAAERSALRYADLLATDHLGIGDSTFADLRENFSENEIVELGVHIGVCVGFGRLAASWDLVDDLPDELRIPTGSAAPWHVTGVVR